MKKISIVLLAFLLVFCVLSLAYAGQEGFPAFTGKCPGHHPMMGPAETEGMPPFLPSLMMQKAGLGLDDKQKQAVREIESRVMKESIRKKADLGIAELELRDLLLNDPVDVSSVEGKVKKIESLKAELVMLHIKGMEEAKSKLTADQRKKLHEAFESGPVFTGGSCGEFGDISSGSSRVRLLPENQ